MLQDIPYSELKKNERAYRILLLRDQEGKSFAQIASEYHISTGQARSIYHKHKRKQIELYINHISFVMGHETKEQIKNIYYHVNDWYQDWAFSCGYLEKKYEDILREYRQGEPGMPQEFIEKMPPFRSGLNNTEIANVIHMREMMNMTFIQIGKTLNITTEKAKHTYNLFYQSLALILFEIYRTQAASEEEKNEMWQRCFYGCRSAKKRCLLLLQECHIQDIIGPRKEKSALSPSPEEEG